MTRGGQNKTILQTVFQQPRPSWREKRATIIPKDVIKTWLAVGAKFRLVYFVFKLKIVRRKATMNFQVMTPKMPCLGRMKQGPFLRKSVMPSPVM